MPLVDNTPLPRTGRGTLIVVAGAFLLLAGAIAIAASSMGAPDPTPGDDGRAPHAAATEQATAPAAPGRVPAARGAAAPDDARADAAAEVHGIVRSRDGRPMVGAMVVLLEAAGAAPGRALVYEAIEFARTARTPTDGAGRFRLPRRAPASPARVSASADGHASAMAFVASDARDEVVLELVPGLVLRGRVSAADGSGVGDGVVSVVQAWSAADFADSPGLALTEPDGTFAIGLAADATQCDLRVDSTRHGRDFFLAVATDVFADLRWQARASLRGRVRGVTSDHVGRLAVRVHGELRDAPVPAFRTGMRRQLVGVGTVRADGGYEVDGLQPGATYGAQLVQVSVEDAAIELSPRHADPFVPAAGQTIERDFEVSAPIVVRGRALTATSRRPAVGLRVQVEFGDQVLWEASRETDADGKFELRLTTGAGSYRLGAGPAPRLVERRFAAGETATVDLTVAEPVVLPVRVVDAGGARVESIRSQLWLTDATGRRFRLGDSRVLDAEGRARFEVYQPTRTLRLDVMRFPHGPRCATATLDVSAGEVLAEQTLTLPAAGDVIARIVDAAGKPRAGATVTITARYGDGETDTFHGQTDRAGRLIARGACRREPATFELSVDDRAPWQSPQLTPSAEGRFELGDVQA